MTPAVFLAMMMAAFASALIALPRLVAPADFALLFVFGALNLGLGMSLFVTGVRLVPATLAALVGTIEPVLGPIWTWLVHGEVPSARTVLGGSFVFGALLFHLGVEWRHQARSASNSATKIVEQATNASD
jgi:drug/metabolite transporter (DMT)-like permease